MAELADGAKENLLTKLQLLEPKELGVVSIALSLTVPPAKKGKKSAMFNLIVRHLSSEDIEESDDNGLQVFQDLLKQVDEILKKNAKTEGTEADKTNDKGDSDSKGDGGKKGSRNEKSDSSTSDEKDKDKDDKKNGKNRDEERYERKGFMFHKLKEFKINGGIAGNSGNIVELQKIIYQMQKGKGLGYTEEEIRIGTIDSMKADSRLRKYFEGKMNLTQEQFMKMLMSWYHVKESEKIFDELKDSAQEPKEEEADYLLRMMQLRDLVIEVTKGEEYPIAEKLVKKKFLHAVLVGFKRDTIRLDLRQVLKDPEMEDDEMTREVNEAVARDKENRRKMKGKEASSNRLGFEDDEVRNKKRSVSFEEDEVKNKKSSTDTVALLEKICKEFSQVAVQVNKLTAWQEQTQKILEKDADDERNGNRDGGNQRGAQGYRFVKCEECEEKRLYCTHCSICGQGGHKRVTCPTKNV